MPTATINKVDGNDVTNYAEAHAAGGVAPSGAVAATRLSDKNSRNSRGSR